MRESEQQPAPSSSPSPREEASNGVLRHSIPRTLWDRKWTVLLTTAAWLAAGVVYLVLATPLYTSRARLIVEPVYPRILGPAEEQALPSINFLRNQAELIQSAGVLAGALRQPGLSGLRALGPAGDAVTRLRSLLVTEVDSKQDVVTVSLESPYPDEGARIVGAVVASYVDYNTTGKRGSAEEGLQILRREKAAQDATVQEALKALMEFRQAHPVLAIEAERSNIEPHFQFLARLSDSLAAAEVETIEAKANYDRVQALAASPEGATQLVEAERAKGFTLGHGVGMGTQADRLRSELVQLESRLSSLRQQGTDAHPGIQGIMARADDLRRQIVDLNEQFANVLVSVAAKGYAAAKEKEDGLRKALEQYREEAVALGNDMGEYRFLDLRWTRAVKVAETLDDRIKELRVAAEAGTVAINVIEPARAPSVPSWPPPDRVLAVALVAGLLCGSGLAFAREGLDQRIRSSEDVEDAIGEAVLSAIPRPNPNGAVHRGRGLKALEDPQGPVAEAYRMARAAILFAAGSPKTILVTSCEAHAGLSLAVSNLAVAMAQSRRRVLVIDANGRGVAQHEILPTTVRKNRLYEMIKNRFEGVIARLGQRPNGTAATASEVLGSQAFDDMLKDVSERYEGAAHLNDGLLAVLSGRLSPEMGIFRTTVENLDLLPSGGAPADLSEQLASRALRDTLLSLTPQYDCILIDSPPLLAMADARALAAVCDATVLVLRADRTSRKRARQARDVLRSVGARILGAIVYGVTPAHYEQYYTGYVYTPTARSTAEPMQ